VKTTCSKVFIVGEGKVREEDKELCGQQDVAQMKTLLCYLVAHGFGMKARLQAQSGESLVSVNDCGSLSQHDDTQHAHAAKNCGGCALQIQGPSNQVIDLGETQVSQLSLTDRVHARASTRCSTFNPFVK